MMNKRGSRLRGPFVVLLAVLVTLLGFTYFNFEALSFVLPKFVELPCTYTSADTHIDAYFKEENQTCDPLCPPVQEKVIVKEKVVERMVYVDSGGPRQWWAEQKPWHKPGKFPLCTMDACFNFTRCENMDELLIYHYDVPTSPVRFFKGFNSTRWYTSDPDKACLFFVFQDLDSPWRPHPREVEHWNNGLNHILITFVDIWEQKNPPEETIGNASVLSSALLETTYRPNFDIGLPLPGREHVRHFQSLKPSDRKYLLTFMGTRYLGHKGGEGVFRSHASFRNMHNGNDVIVVTTCKHGTNDIVRQEAPEKGAGCDEDQVLYDQYEFHDLMNATFALAPAGVSGSSYRMIEILSGGIIPVLIVDNHVNAFENIIPWPRCVLQFPTTEMHRIVPAVRAMSQEDIEERQKYCLWVYEEFLKDDPTLLRSTIRALKARFYGVFPKFSEALPIFERRQIEQHA